MRKKFKNMLRFIAFIFLCTLLLGASYIMYDNSLKRRPEIKVINDLSINYKDGRLFKVSEDEIVHFSIINNSSLAKYYYIEFKNIKGAKNAEYSLTDNNSLNINDKIQKYNFIVADYILIDANETIDYTLSLKNSENKSFSVEINVDEQLLSTNSFADVILRNNNVKSNSETIVGKDEAKGNEGLIKSVDQNGTSYYFRGSVDNNYVEINGIIFRIVRINSDSSVSLVLDGITNSLKKYYEDENNFSFNNSSLQTYLLEWFNSNLYDYSNLITAYHYCDDTVMNNNVLSSYNRIKKDNIISNVCLGNEVLSKVGLLTVDDVIFAGGSLNDINKDFYLYNSSIDNQYFLMTGATYSNKIFYPFIVSIDGKILNNVPGNYLRGIRPVITVAKTVNVTGSGAVNDPYILTQD